MSGPKCADYEVRRNRELEARARRQALVRAHELRTRLETVLGEVASARSRYPRLQAEVPVTAPVPIADDANLDAIEAYRRLLSEAISAAQRALRGAVARAETESALAQAVEGLSAAVGREEPEEKAETAAAGRSPAAPRPRRRGEALTDTGTREDRIRAAVTSLLDDVLPSAEEEIRALAVQVQAERDSERADLLLTELRMRVQAANSTARRVVAGIDEAETLLAELRGLEGAEVSEVCDALDRVTRREAALTEKLRQRVVEVRTRARREADRQYAGSVLRRAFLDLGYEVGDEFATLFADRGVVYCEKPGWRGYSVCARVSPDRGQLDFNIVRFAEARGGAAPESRIRDREIEESWCTDFDRVVATLEQDGIRCANVRRSPPGSVPVPVVLRTGVSVKRQPETRKVVRKARE